ncbi:MAG: hypothetical protein AB9866_15140 [Syntrophobacteraceae bacterium]
MRREKKRIRDQDLQSHLELLSNTTMFAYDAAGQLAPVTDPLGNVTGFGYDENGNRMLANDPRQNNTLYSHNFRGLPTQRTDALGAITTFAYGGSGCQTSNGGGEKLTALTDAVGSTTKKQRKTKGSGLEKGKM